MKVIQILLVLCLIGFVSGCSSVYDVQYDYDLKVEFKGLKTYDWLPVPDKADINSLDIARVKAAVNAEMQAKGLVMTSDNPDILIAEHLGKKDKINVRNWGYGYSSYGGYWGGHWGSGGVSVYEYEEGSLILDFVDAKSKKMIWRGMVKVELDDQATPEEKESLIKEAIQKILKNFPPPAAK